jgi:hypothetical protein
MILKALTFDIIGTVFDAYDGLAQGVGPLNAKYGLNVQGSSFASGSLAGYVAGVGRFLSGQGWTPPDTILQDATAGLLPIQQLGPKVTTTSRSGSLASAASVPTLNWRPITHAASALSRAARARLIFSRMTSPFAVHL